MDERQKNNLKTTIGLIVVFGQFILWIILILLDKV
jgi:hypothetical protein